MIRPLSDLELSEYQGRCKQLYASLRWGSDLSKFWHEELDIYSNKIAARDWRGMNYPGVYFLWSENGLEYIGRSEDIKFRLMHHSVYKRRYGWIIGAVRVDDYIQMSIVEDCLISMFKPPRNKYSLKDRRVQASR